MNLPGTPDVIKILNLIAVIIFCLNVNSQTIFDTPVINQYSSVISILNKNTSDRDTIEVANPEFFSSRGIHAVYRDERSRSLSS